MLQGRTDVAPAETVPWFDSKVVRIGEVVTALDAQTHRRCIKTHTPREGIPWLEDAAYIAVYRHPLDVLFSLRSHTANMKMVAADHPHFLSADECLKDFVGRGVDHDAYDESLLEAIVEHYRSFAQGPDNLLVLHYADMLADPRTAIERMAAHMGISPTPALLDEICAATSFDSMKSRSDQFAPFAKRDVWHDDQAFFDSGGTDKWIGKLSADSIALYQERIGTLLAPQAQAWLEGGDRAGHPLLDEAHEIAH